MNSVFRKLGKERLVILVPPEIADLVRGRAAQQRRSAASVATELLALGFGLDPAQFGIARKPRTASRRPVSVTR